MAETEGKSIFDTEPDEAGEARLGAKADAEVDVPRHGRSAIGSY